jgi:hypothetical protein
VTALTVPDVLRRAESLIAGHWSRTGYEYRAGRYCPIEALDEVCDDEPRFNRAFSTGLFSEAYAALREEVGGEVTMWNGRPERTEAEVRAALLAAAARAEAGT